MRSTVLVSGAGAGVGAPLGSSRPQSLEAGKDLISLSQERGASLAYSALARALGVLVERKHSSLEHGAAVWIHEPGEMQPRRATVARAARADAREVLVEFWDGDAPEMWVQRALVSKARARSSLGTLGRDWLEAHVLRPPRLSEFSVAGHLRRPPRKIISCG